MLQSVIQTERLILRPLNDKDAARIQYLANHPLISDMTSQIPYPYTIELAQSWLSAQRENWLRGKGIVYGIVLKSLEALIGVVSLQKRDGESGPPVLGFWLGVDFWGNGYASEAVDSLCHYAFCQLNLHWLAASHLQRNPASGAVLAKSGFTLSGKEQRLIKNSNKTEMVFNYRLSRSLYQAKNDC